MTDVVTSRRQLVVVRYDEGKPTERAYQLAPLTMLERQQFRRDMIAAGALSPGLLRMRQLLRDALAELAPNNLDELVATLDACEAAEDAGMPLSAQLVRDRETLVLAAMAVPFFASARAADQLWWDLMPQIILRRALRGWEGAGLPPFRRPLNEVPDELLEAVEGDILSLGWRAYELAYVPASAGNSSGAPSPAPAPQTGSEGG